VTMLLAGISGNRGSVPSGGIYLSPPKWVTDSGAHQVSYAVGIATGYGLDDRGVGARVPIGSRQEFSLLCGVQTGSAVHPASYPMGTGGKAAGA
jgi:hypothetical protein